MVKDDKKQEIQAFPLSIPSDPNLVYSVNDSFPPLSFFQKDILHPAIIVPSQRTAELRRTLSSLLMHRPKVKNVYPIAAEDAIDGTDAPKERKLVLKLECDHTDPLLQTLLDDSNNNVRKSSFVFSTQYEHYNVEETLKQILPSTLPEIPSAFEVVGHIAHLNLRDDCLPYKYLIGKVILDKNSSLQLVVNKVGNVEGEFRTFPMEIIGSSNNNFVLGKDTLEVEVKEEGCRFQLNFQHVYWNSRLQYEHKRLVQHIAGKRHKPRNKQHQKQPHQTQINEQKDAIVVADIMAGVGKFNFFLLNIYF